MSFGEAEQKGRQSGSKKGREKCKWDAKDKLGVLLILPKWRKTISPSRYNIWSPWNEKLLEKQKWIPALSRMRKVFLQIVTFSEETTRSLIQQSPGAAVNCYMVCVQIISVSRTLSNPDCRDLCRVYSVSRRYMWQLHALIFHHRKKERCEEYHPNSLGPNDWVRCYFHVISCYFVFSINSLLGFSVRNQDCALAHTL